MAEMNVKPNEDIEVKKIPVYRMRGRVVHGFGRGSKLLGFPTANLDPKAFKQVLSGVARGVYCGWVSISGGAVHKALVSLGENPHFHNKEETTEAYILHDFGKDFYDEEMCLAICGYLRPQQSFASLDDLIIAIKRDVRIGQKALDTAPFVNVKDDIFFKQKEKKDDKEQKDGEEPSKMEEIEKEKSRKRKIDEDQSQSLGENSKKPYENGVKPREG